jgi:ATP/ADP translocase
MVVCFFGLAAVIFWGYGIAASATQIMFLQVYGAERLPGVWAAIGLACFAAVAAMSWALRRWSVAATLKITAGLSAAGFAGLLLAQAWGVPGAVYALFVFKDVYIVLLSELFWSLANGEFAQLRAIKVYGLFCAAGSLGGALGNLLAGPGAAAWQVPNEVVMQSVVPLCLLAMIGTALTERRLQAAVFVPAPASLQGSSFMDSLRSAYGVIRHSRLLPLMLLLVLTVQISLTVADYHFNRVLTLTYSDVDERRRIFGSLSALTNGLSLVLQLGTGLVVRCLGASRTLLAIPLSLLVCMLGQLLMPGFASISLVRLVGKSNDYSLFRAVKEGLYIPLSYAERTEGKAVIDMLTYRLAKAPAAALIWLVTACCVDPGLGLLNVALCILWLGITRAILRRKQAGPCDKTTSTPPAL